MVRIDLPDIHTTNRLIEALHVAAGARSGTDRAAEWRQLAADVEAALDALPPQPVTDHRTHPAA